MVNQAPQPPQPLAPLPPANQPPLSGVWFAKPWLIFFQGLATSVRSLLSSQGVSTTVTLQGTTAAAAAIFFEMNGVKTWDVAQDAGGNLLVRQYDGTGANPVARMTYAATGALLFAPASPQTVHGSRNGNAALTDALNIGANLGLWINGSTA